MHTEKWQNEPRISKCFEWEIRRLECVWAWGGGNCLGDWERLRVFWKLWGRPILDPNFGSLTKACWIEIRSSKCFLLGIYLGLNLFIGLFMFAYQPQFMHIDTPFPRIRRYASLWTGRIKRLIKIAPTPSWIPLPKPTSMPFYET